MRVHWVLWPMSLCASVAFTTAANAQSQAARNSPDGVAETARLAYIYAYPLVTMAVTKRVATNVATATSDGHAPVNQFGSLFAYPTAAFREVVAPNVNTLYTQGWLDVSSEPMVVHLPNTNERYFVMQMLDAWTNVIASVGKRTTGTKEQDIAIVGPGWKGQIPAGIAHTYMSPTSTVWIINRIQAEGPKDYPVVNALQRAMHVTPLSMYGKPYTPPPGAVDAHVDMKTAPRAQVNGMSADSFFTVFARELAANPPAPADTGLLRRMMGIGIVPGQAFKMSNNAATAKEIRDGARLGLEAIERHANVMGTIEHHWQTLNMCGRYGTEYLTRAAVALVGLGCNLPADALYPTTRLDAEGQPLVGSHRYVIHFAAGQLPPVNAFWSVTMYDSAFYLVNNPIDRSAVSSYAPLKLNPDGSLDIYVQRESPGAERRANWLPAPEGAFVLMSRLYWPKEAAISGAWTMPAAQKTP